MKIKYIKEAEKKTSCYVINISYEHGDADSYNDYDFQVNLKEKEFIEYLKKFDEVKNQIEESHKTGTSLPKNFEEQAKYKDIYIPLEHDNYAKMHMSGYFASISISNIYYYDAQGEKYKCEIENN